MATGVVVVALAGWLASLSTQYVLATGVMRFHVENSAVLFVAAGFLGRIARDRHGMLATAREAFPCLPHWTLPLWWACAIVLYASTLRIGFLSDDFVLADRAGGA